MLNSLQSPFQKDYSTAFLAKSSLLVTLSSFSMGILHTGYQIGVLNMTENQLCTFFHWDSSQSIFITSSSALLCIGASIGSLFSGRIINFFGRRKGILFNNTLMLCFISLSIIPNEYTFLLFRFCTGFCTGICSTVPPIFINEISPQKIKAMLGIFIQLMISFGIFVAFAVGGVAGRVFSGYWSWALPILFPCSAIIVQSYCYIEKFRFDTPKWLLFNNRQADVEIVMRKIYKPWAWQSRLTDLEDEKTSIRSITEALPGIMTRSLSRPMTLAYMLCVFQQLTGINVLMFYSKAIFVKYDEFYNLSFELTLLIGLCNFLSVLPCFFVFRTVSRRVMLLQGCAGLCCCYLALVAICYFDTEFYPNWLELGLILLSLGFYETSFGSIVWIYVTELISFEWIGNAIFAQWVCAAGISAVYPLLFQYGGVFDYQVIYVFFGVTCAFGFVMIYNFTVDTKMVNIEEVAKKFSRRTSVIESEGS